MRLLFVAFVATFVLVGCKSSNELREEAAIALAKDRLKDPESAKWKCEWKTSKKEWSGSQLERYHSDGPLLECDIRAKNGFGGYGDDISFDFLFYSAGSNEVLSAYYFHAPGSSLRDWRWIKIK